MKIKEADKLVQETSLTILPSGLDSSIIFISLNGWFIGRFIIKLELFEAKLELYDVGENEQIENRKTYEDYDEAKKAILVKIKENKEHKLKEKIKELNTDFS